MALKLDSVCKATYKFKGSSLKLSTRYEKLAALRDAIDGDPHIYIGRVFADGIADDGTITPASFENIKERFLNVLFFLQDDVEEYSLGQIHDAFFGNLAEFMNEENFIEANTVLGHLMGFDISAKIEELAIPDTNPKKA